MANIIPMMSHFMRQDVMTIADQSRNRQTSLNVNAQDDLRLQKDFFNWAAAGLSLNLMSYCQPTIFHRSDACDHGIGSYNIYSGQAWRFELSVDCRLRVHINVLEFLASTVSIWVEVIASRIPAESCLLSQSDNMSTTTWLRKSTFSDDTCSKKNDLDSRFKLILARKLACCFMSVQSCLYSQWFKGDWNEIGDSLSRDFHLPDSDLSVLLMCSLPEQAPAGLHISTPPT
jgi:hypothetical protein